VVVIAHDLWQRAFAGDPAVLGRTLLLNGTKYTVVGVMPPEFGFPMGAADPSRLWAPLQLDPRHANNNSHDYLVIGRLKPGISLAQAQAELDAHVRHHMTGQSGHHLDAHEHPLVTYPAQDEAVRDIRSPLRILFGAACFLLLSACINVAALLLVRAEARHREIAIRGALGAGLPRLARQFLTEGLLLSLLGTAAGLALGYAALRLIELVGAADIPRVQEIGLDSRVLLFAVAVSSLTGLVFGLAPLVRVIGQNPQDALKSTLASVTGGTGKQRFRHLLVASQVALALILLSGTGLMLRTFWKLEQVYPGFEAAGLVTMYVALPSNAYKDESTRNFWSGLQERLSALPGVQSVALASAVPPLTDTGIGFSTGIEGVVPVEGGSIPSIHTEEGLIPLVDYLHVVSPSDFETLRIRLASGRYFDRRDDTQAPRVAIINQTLARAIWGNGSALGHRLRPGISDEWYTVVGVIADVKNDGVQNATRTEIYLPYTQAPAYSSLLRGVHIIIRSGQKPSAVVDSVRRVLAAMDPTLPLTKIQTMEEVLAAAQATPRFLTWLLSLFGALAMVLAIVGIYGVISYSVEQRTREFGIRMALGASQQAVRALVLGRGLVLTVSGVVIGLLGTLALTHLLASFLFGVTRNDPATLAGACVFLGVAAGLASYLPARRATRVDPIIALRSE
jgi:predicted permease